MKDSKWREAKPSAATGQHLRSVHLKINIFQGLPMIFQKKNLPLFTADSTGASTNKPMLYFLVAVSLLVLVVKSFAAMFKSWVSTRVLLQGLVFFDSAWSFLIGPFEHHQVMSRNPNCPRKMGALPFLASLKIRQWKSYLLAYLLGERSRYYVVSPQNNSNCLAPMQFELVFCSQPPFGAKMSKCLIKTKSVQVSPPPEHRNTTPCTFTEWKKAFVGPLHQTKISRLKQPTTT